MRAFTVPALFKTPEGRFLVTFHLEGKRHRFACGKAFGLALEPNRMPAHKRREAATELCFQIHAALRDGWRPHLPESHVGFPSDSDRLKALDAFNRFTPEHSFTPAYKKALEGTKDRFKQYLGHVGLEDMLLADLKAHHIIAFMQSRPMTVPTFNHELKHLSSILSRLLAPHGLSNPCSQVKKKKEKPQLHKPFDDVPAILSEVREFSEKLWLCCALTYGCLLRPHQEIRQLTWRDFSDDLSFISLSGRRNKSGRTRIVPLSPAIAVQLEREAPDNNIFSGSEMPHNPDYFKTLWGKFKRRSELLQRDQTLYSFRHTGAIEVYRRTGSLNALQQAMGHASLAVSLGYLRNLEVPQLELSDMPQVGFNQAKSSSGRIG